MRQGATVYSPVNLCSLCPPNMLCPWRQASRQLKPQSLSSSGLCKEPPHTDSNEQSETRGSQGHRASGGHSPRQSGHLRKQLCLRSHMQPGTGKWRLRTIALPGQGKSSDRRGVCQPRLLPLDPTVECLFLTTCKMKAPCGCRAGTRPSALSVQLHSSGRD